jgi:hypothetical protein
MPIMNFSELRDARTIRYLHKYSGGMGLAAHQFVMGGAVAFIIIVVFALINVVIHGILFPFGLGIALAFGLLVTRESNKINTKNKLPQRYFRGEVRKPLIRRKPLILDDERFAYPGAEIEDFVVRVMEFPPSTEEDNYDR